MKRVLIVGHGPQSKPKVKNTVFVTLDMIKYPEVDKVWNLEKLPLPFKKNEFDEIWAYHVIEHVSKDKFDKLMENLYRILKPEGLIKIKVPFFSSFMAFHVDHKNFFTYTSFNKFEPFHPLHREKKVSFKIKKREIIFGTQSQTRIFNFILNPIINAFPLVYCRLFCWILPSEELQFELEVVK